MVRPNNPSPPQPMEGTMRMSLICMVFTLNMVNRNSKLMGWGEWDLSKVNT